MKWINTWSIPRELRRWLSSTASACRCRRLGFDPWDGEIPWRRKWQPTSVSLPGKPHRQEPGGVTKNRTQLSDWTTTSIGRIVMSTWQSWCYFHDSFYFEKSALVMLKSGPGRWQNQQLLIKFVALLYSWTFPDYYFVSGYVFWAWDPSGTETPAWQMAPQKAQERSMWRAGRLERDFLQSNMCVQKRKKKKKKKIV